MYDIQLRQVTVGDGWERCLVEWQKWIDLLLKIGSANRCVWVRRYAAPLAITKP